MQWISRISISSTLLAALFIPLSAQAKNISTKDALACVESSKCAYFFDVYAGDKQLRQQLNKAFKIAGIPAPRWLGNGTSTPMTPIILAQKTYLLGSVCQPHNCPHSISILYSPEQKRVVAQYQPKTGTPKWLGEPSAAEQQILNEFETANSPLQKKLDSHSKLPIIIN
ncbi:Ivy family c-type lysozyme inhibitor [Iodobacter arcticus]|uniref:Ivy family c-type lysozyme inhibitor n=1 Tax=Iodobacter arcticus TaxID=590593 RepID=A0ABW2QVF2_9NEIS